MRRSVPYAVIAGLLAGGSAVAADRFALRSWTAGCDADGRCVAAVDALDRLGHMALRLERGGAQADAPQVVLLLGGFPLAEDRRTLRLDIEDADGDVTYSQFVRVQPSLRPGAPSVVLYAPPTMIAALRDGRRVLVTDGSGWRGLSLSGSSAALRWIDDRQGRAGRADALVARGR